MKLKHLLIAFIIILLGAVIYEWGKMDGNKKKYEKRKSSLVYFDTSTKHLHGTISN